MTPKPGDRVKSTDSENGTVIEGTVIEIDSSSTMTVKQDNGNIEGWGY